MSGLFAEPFAALLLEDAHFRAARLAVDDTHHFGAAHERRTGGHFSTVPRQKQHLIEGHLLASLGGLPVELDGGAFRDLDLTTSSLNDRVHGPSLNVREHKIISHEFAVYR